MNIRCNKCGARKNIPCQAGFSGATIPMTCDRNGAPAIDGGSSDCGMNPFAIMPDSCTYIDQQSFKLQEAPEVVPTGEMPRNILLSVDRNLVDKVSPGT